MPSSIVDERDELFYPAADAAEKQRDKQACKREHLDGVIELIYAKRRAAVFGKHALAYLRLGLGRVKGVVAGLAGDYEQHRRGSGDHARLEDQAAVCRLIQGNIRQ